MLNRIVALCCVFSIAYGAVNLALMQFRHDYYILIIPRKDGDFIAKDVDTERAKRDYLKRVKNNQRE